MLIAAAPSQIGMKIRAAMGIVFIKRPASRQAPSKRKPPSTTMIVCISLLLPSTCAALRFVRLPLGFFRLLVIADDAFQGADAECRAFLAGRYDGNRTQGHLAPPSMFHAVSRGLASFAPALGPVVRADARAERALLRPGFPHRGRDLDREFHPVLPVLVFPLVGKRRKKLMQQVTVRRMQLEHVEADAPGAQRGADEILYQNL